MEDSVRLRLISDGTQEGTRLETEDGKKVKGFISFNMQVGVDDLGSEINLVLADVETLIDVKDNFKRVAVYELGNDYPIGYTNYRN